MTRKRRSLLGAVALTLALCAPNLRAQDSSRSEPPVVLTLKRSIELALQNSKEIQLAKIQTHVADELAIVTKSEFQPNLYLGSGAGYTYGLPETPGGRPPSIFNVTYNQRHL